MREIEHITLYERLLNLFIGPINEEFVIEIGFLGQATWKVDWVLETGPIPVCFKKNAKLLGSSQRKDRYQNLSAFVEGLVYLPQKLSFSGPFWVANRGSVGGLGQHDIRSQLIDPSRAQVSVSCHIVITRVDDRLPIALNVEHASTEDMTRVIGRDFNVSELDCLVQLNGLNFIDAVLNHLRTEAI